VTSFALVIENFSQIADGLAGVTWAAITVLANKETKAGSQFI